MPVYARKVATNDPRFAGRKITITTHKVCDVIPVPDNVVLCDGCNKNIAAEEVAEGKTPIGYLIYLGKRELVADQPYDIFCLVCLNKYFPKAILEK